MSRAAWTTSLAGAFWPMSFAVLANAPGRYAMALREHQFGRDVPTTLALAVLADAACLGPLVTLLLVLPDWVATRRRGGRVSARIAFATAAAAVVLVGVFMWLVSVGATEFRIQRGSYPVLAETLDGLGDATFIRGAARIALFERYSLPTIVALFGFVAVLVAYGRAHLRRVPVAPLAAVLGPAMGTLGAASLAAALFVVLRAFAPPTTSDGLWPPLIRLLADVRAPERAGHRGVRAVLESTDLGELAVRRGLHWLGFGDAHARALLAGDSRTACAMHPLARPLPGDTNESPVSEERREEPTPLVRRLVELSAALFEQRDEPLTVWHVAMESFRADDIHALHPPAPAELAEFVNAAYVPSERGGPGKVAFRHAYQSGLRTAQAVSGLWCGLGALPFQLALSRDLYDVPFRCTPDVLGDAGFETRLYYGSNATFEHLDQFAGRHGVAITDLSTLPAELPRGAFRAITDAALLGVALRDSVKAPLSYRLVLTISGHSPFDLPEDVSPATQTGVGNIVAGLRTPLAAEDRRRLVTMAYTDQAIAAFIRAIETSSEANRTLFLVSADHATADPFLWGDPTPNALAQVPLFFYLPAALVASSKEPGRVEEALRSLDDLTSTIPVSINDVPTLLLALLAHHPALQKLAPQLRWHTLGGASSSPHFAGTSPTTAQVWGIDASSRVFVVGPDAADRVVDTGERSVAFSVWDEPLGPLLKDVTGALSAVLRACSGTCGAPSDGRKRCVSSRQSMLH